jgi:hypothetical protein
VLLTYLAFPELHFQEAFQLVVIPLGKAVYGTNDVCTAACSTYIYIGRFVRPAATARVYKTRTSIYESKCL